MGYNTEYTGRFELSRVLTYEEINRIENWNSRTHTGYGPSLICGWSIGYGRAMKNYLVVDLMKMLKCREVLISLAEIKFFKPKPVNMVK